MNKPWAARANREVATKYFKVIRAQEEIIRLNVEIHRLHRWVSDEDKHLIAKLDNLQKADKPLAAALSAYTSMCHRVNDIHHRRLKTLYKLKGFTSTRVDVEDTIVSEAEDILVSEVDLTGLMADEDDTLNDEMHRLAECIENIR
jgi:hypothetical protein